MEIEVRIFRELSSKQLYDLLQLRSEVFVVEQDCVYQDIDGKDENALHLLCYKEDELVGYSRCFPPGFYFKEAAIGRVVIRKEKRELGYGHMLLKASIAAISDYFKTRKIKISAQEYLTEFYNSHGFRQTGDGYLEDGIPHIAMIKTD